MEFIKWIFFGPAKLIALWPYAGAVIAGALISLQAWLTWRNEKPFGRGFFRQPLVFAGVLWLIFNACELQMSAISAKTDGGTLRMDLIVLVPILYVLTTAGVLSLVKQMKPEVKRSGTDSDQ